MAEPNRPPRPVVTPLSEAPSLRRERAEVEAMCARRRNCLAWHTNHCPRDEDCCVNTPTTARRQPVSDPDPTVQVDNHVDGPVDGNVVQLGVNHGDINFGTTPSAGDTEED